MPREPRKTLIEHTKAKFGMTIPVMGQHVYDLCDKFEIQIELNCGTKCRSFRDLQLIEIRPIESEITYAAALHEIGHLRGQYQDSVHTLVRERWAWRWAKAHAKIWTTSMESNMSNSLKWYEARIGSPEDLRISL